MIRDRGERLAADPPRVLMLVANLSVPTDRRVWQECSALREEGYEVAVVCPKGERRDTEPYEVVGGIEIHRYDPIWSAGGVASYIREYLNAYRQTRALSLRLARRQPFHVVHAASPPDFLLHAVRRLRDTGTCFVFDHHDLSPELYETRYGRRDVVHRLLLALERHALRTADIVITTNESYRRIAIARGRRDANDVVVVRNGPDLRRFQPQKPDASLKGGAEHLIAYVGMMGPQDGIEHALLALHELRALRTDWRAIFVGDGDIRPRMEALARMLGLENQVEFTGLAGEEVVLQVLSTADVCLAPEPSNPLNDVSTMIKVAEYMAMGCPLVAYDLPETRATAEAAALYAASGNTVELATCLSRLLADPERRSEMGAYGRRRVEECLSWERSSTILLAVYKRLLRGRDGTRAAVAAEPVEVARGG